MHNKLKILISGTAGFIGFSLARNLLANGVDVVGVDNHDAYYDPKLKQNRVKILKHFKGYHHHKIDIVNDRALKKIFKKHMPNIVIHLAAQAGVRFSINNPKKYIQSNLQGFFNIIHLSSEFKVKNFIYASSSSVYSGNLKTPFSEEDSADHPLNLYAATKKSNELIAHSYSNLFNLRTTGLRFFTVYGPWGRPDMAYFHFVKSIINKKTINLHNFGNHLRDFTYIDDIVNGVVKIINKPAKKNLKWKIEPNLYSSFSPWKVYNIGNSSPVNLIDFVTEIEKAIGIKAKIKLLPLQKGEAVNTHSDSVRLYKDFKYKPKYSLEYGIKKFVEWYLVYYKIKIT